METTIDKAGRIVIPAPIRERLGLRAGSRIEILVEDGSVRLVRAVPRPRVVREGGRLLVRPTVPPGEAPAVDVARLVEQERNRGRP